MTDWPLAHVSLARPGVDGKGVLHARDNLAR